MVDVGFSREARDMKIKGVFNDISKRFWPLPRINTRIFDDIYAHPTNFEGFPCWQVFEYIFSLLVYRVTWTAGGNSDIPGYISTFSTLEKEQLLGKIVRLSISENLEEVESKLPSLPRLVVEGLFMKEKLLRAVTKLSPLIVGSVSTVTTNGGLISPQSPARMGERIIDPSLVRRIFDRIPNLRHWLSCS